jgi:hypothetical protein
MALMLDMHKGHVKPLSHVTIFIIFYFPLVCLFVPGIFQANHHPGVLLVYMNLKDFKLMLSSKDVGEINVRL